MTEPDGGAFRTALSDFTFEAACGAAIRHLAASGCTAKQIMERLDYPVPGERVRKALYQYLCDTNIILEESPEKGLPEAKPEYVLEYHSCGKPSYRKKSAEDTAGSDPGVETAGAAWTESVYRPAANPWEPVSEDLSGRSFERVRRGMVRDVRDLFQTFGWGNREKPAARLSKGAGLEAFLTEKCDLRKGETAYVSCDFGISGSIAARGITLLNGRQQEYLEGIPWPRHRVYHRLDHRMKEIICSLFEQHAYEGICYFMSGREKWNI